MTNKVPNATPLARTSETSPPEKNSVPVALPPTRQQEAEERRQQQIRDLAFRLYEERGRVDGFAERDWFEAEAMIRQQGKMAA